MCLSINKNSDQAANQLSIEYLSLNQVNLFQKFMENNWASNHIFSKDSSVLDWQYKSSNSYNLIVAKKKGILIGVQGYIPLSHFDNNLNNNQIFLALWATSQNGGIGIGLRVHKKLISEVNPKFIGSVGINEKVVSFHKWQGFNVGKMVHSVAVSPFIKNYTIAGIPKKYKIIPGRIEQGVNFKIIGLKELTKIKNKNLFSQFWPTKSIEYIINRYLNNPFYSYEIYRFNLKNKLLGLFVIRIILENGKNVLRIVDYYGSNESLEKSYALFIYLLKKYNAEYIDLYSLGIPKKSLEIAGLISIGNQEELIIPNYFEPFVKKNIDITYAYKAEKPHPPIRLFKGDGDQDRPSLIKGINC